MSQTLVVRNVRAIVCSDSTSTVLRDADLVCQDGVIVAMGKGCGQAFEQDGLAEVIDGSDWFVYPGLINTHHHFFQAFVRNQRSLDWPTLSLLEWLAKIYPIFALLDEECIYHASLVSMAELIKFGCTTAFDHQYCFNRNAGSNQIDRQFEAAAKLGIRFVAGRGTNTLPASQGSTMPDEMLETTDEYLRDCERITRRYHDPNPFAMRSVVLAPCQPVNCLVETFVESIKFAQQEDLCLHTHLGEGENQLMLERHGMRSLDWCIDIGFVGPKVWFAHGWEFTEEEMFRLAAEQTGLSHCPAAMCLVGDGITDLCSAFAAGVRVGLGVDGQASNDNANLLSSIHQAYLLQSLGAKQRRYAVPPVEQFLYMACNGGASLLQRPELGSLEIGKAADFFAINANAVELVGAAHDPESLLVKTGYHQPTEITVINGEVVWRDQQFCLVDEMELARNAQQVFESKVLSSAPVVSLSQHLQPQA